MSLQIKTKKEFTLYDVFLYFCVLLSGLVPRYILTFKIHIVIGISLFTVSVLLIWFLFVRHIKFYKKIESYFFLIWFILILCSIWRAQRIGIWASYVDWIITAILFMQIVYQHPSEKTFEIIIRGIVDALFIQLLIGLYEIITHNYLFEIGNISKRLYGNVAISMFHNLNDYASFVVTILPFAIYLLIKKTGLFSRVYYLFIIVVSVFLALRSESRGAVLGLVLIIGTILFLFFRKSKKNKLIGAFVACFIVLLIFASPQIRETIYSSVATSVADQSGKSNEIRINLIKNGLVFLKQTYGFGVGAGNLYQWLSEKTVYPVGDVLFMHNWYLEIAVTFGVVFFVVYLVFHLKIIINLLKKFSIQKGFWTINNTILISFVAFSLVSVSSSSNIYSEWVWMYLVFISSFSLFAKNNIEIPQSIT